MCDTGKSAAGISSPRLHCWRFFALLNVVIAAAFYAASGRPLAAIPNTVAAVMFLAFIGAERPRANSTLCVKTENKEIDHNE